MIKTSKSQNIDYPLLITVVILMVLGILILASVAAGPSQQKVGQVTYFLFHQILWGIAPGILLAYLFFKLPTSFFRKWAWFFILANLFLMFLVFMPKIGMAAGGAARWIRLGPISFQPSEFLKLTFILYLSAWLANRVEGKKQKKELSENGERKDTFIPFLIVIGVVAFLLILQSDLSTLEIIITVAVLMYFSAKTPVWQTLFIFLVIIAAVFLLIKFEPYRMERVLVFLGAKEDPMGTGYQMKQALITIGSGRIFGLGLGMSEYNIPQPMTDSIFAVFSQELGFLGSSILVILLIIFLWRGFKIFKKGQDKFSQLLVVGISSWVCLQAFFNIGSMIGILPLMGIPLPFVSYGGSHILTELVGVGILLNISKNR